MAYSDNVLPRSVDGIALRMDMGDILVRRWLGCWIDLIVGVGILFVAILLMAPLKQGGVGGVLGLLAILAYYPITEWLWGQTLGKRITGLVVVDAAGRPPGLRRALARTATRLIEVNPFLLGGLPAGIIVMASKRRQRLGDMLAGTYVIPKSDLARIGRSAADADASIFD